jgi:hypothetical protein
MNPNSAQEKNKTSLDPVLIEIMQQEITRHTHLFYIQISYNAQACYHRIIPELEIMIRQKYGVPKSITNIFRKALQETKYYIKLGNEITSHFYGSNKETYLYGTGHGSRCPPYIWLLLSPELFKIYAQSIH